MSSPAWESWALSAKRTAVCVWCRKNSFSLRPLQRRCWICERNKYHADTFLSLCGLIQYKCSSSPSNENQSCITKTSFHHLPLNYIKRAFMLSLKWMLFIPTTLPLSRAPALLAASSFLVCTIRESRSIISTALILNNFRLDRML